MNFLLDGLWKPPKWRVKQKPGVHGSNRLVKARLDIHINANDTYRSEIIDFRLGNQSRDSEVVMGSLVDSGD